MKYTERNIDSQYWFDLSEKDNISSSSAITLLSQSKIDRFPSLRAGVLSCLNTLIRLWSFRSKLQKPDLYDFISGIFNDLTNAHLLFTQFKNSLTMILLKDSGSEVGLALSFMIQCAKNQPKFFNKMFFNSADFEEHKILQALKIIIKRTSTRSGFYKEREILKEVRLKISALFLMLLKNDLLPRRIQLKLWEEFFEDGFRFAIEEFLAATESSGERVNFIFQDIVEAIRGPIENQKK